MIEALAEVAFNKPLTPDTWLMGLRSAAIAGSAWPGQFVMVRLGKCVDPLLRRPFSICGTEGELFLLLYRIVGKGTAIMAGEITPGASLSVIGCLGNGFRIPEEEGSLILVGGGIGIAPLLFLAQKLGSRKFRFMAGFRTAEAVIPAQEILDLSVPLEISTDDGTEGYHGPVTGLLEKYLESNPIRPYVFACGPREMLKGLAVMAERRAIPFQASMEANMACGLGACLGCVVKGSPGETSYYHVCSDGPVFEGPMIDWTRV